MKKKQNFVEVYKDKIGYDTSEYENTKLLILATYLTRELTSPASYNFYVNWLKKGEWCILGNAYELSEHGEKIFVHQQEFLSEKAEPEEDDPFVFVSTRKQLIGIIDKWAELMTRDPRPKQILITQDEHGEVKLEAIEE